MSTSTDGPPISAAQLAALPPEFRALLQSVIDHYEQRIAAQEVRIQSLEAELASRKTPRNSSLPPSTQHPHAKPPPPPRPPSTRRRGGQPGHPKQERALLSPEDCDAVIPLKPTRCRQCGKRLSGTDPDPWRHQVWEVPQPQPIVTEYQRHRLTCACGCTTCAVLPAGVPEHTSGPRLVALAALLMAYFRQSKSRAAAALETLFGVPASPALMVKLQNQATAALTPCYDELKAALPRARVVACDETAMKEGSQKTWLWVATATLFTVFQIAKSRAADVVQGLLGPKFRGTVSTDRYAGYNADNRCRQICWAHLKRDFQARIDSGGSGKIGERLMEHLREVFRHWHDYRAGIISRRALKFRVHRHVLSQMWETLEDGMRSPHAPTRALCGDLFQRFDQLWRFLDHAGVEPTNNRAEQVLRHAVIWRKLSFGTHSAAGSRFVETLLSVIETARQQQRNLFDLLTAAIETHQHGDTPLSLLPGE